jgi:serine/threonine protein phosphatase PrpC
MLNEGNAEPQDLADHLLAEAVEMDDGRPRDDISVVVVAVKQRAEYADDVRRLGGRLPLRF